MNILQHRLQEETPLLQAGEGLSPEQRVLIQLSEVRARLKADKKLEEDLTKTLKDHYSSTGELVETESQRMQIETATSRVYDEDMLALRLGSRFQDCQSFDKARLDAMVKLGKVSDQELEGAWVEKKTDRLTIREVK